MSNKTDDLFNAVVSVEIEFSNGSFQEWTEASGDTFPQAFIDQWETEYNEVITTRLQSLFPNAEYIEVGEGYDQMMNTKANYYLADGFVVGEDVFPDEQIILAIESVYDDANANIDQLWQPPTLQTVTNAIEAVNDDAPIGQIVFDGSHFCYIKKDDDYYWLDLTINDIFDADDADEWVSGTSEGAARAFMKDAGIDNAETKEAVAA